MGLGSFNKQSRPGLFRRLSGETLDLLIIGGGITGASVFRDAALRGMRVALVEANDFASATSGRSSKLKHGLRYLKNLGLRLAWESCHERNRDTRGWHGTSRSFTNDTGSTRTRSAEKRWPSTKG